MDCRALILVCFLAILAFFVANIEGRTKKIVIHVPYKLKKLKHTHTVYKTVHHHHTHHDHFGYEPSLFEEHEHFHHFHSHEEPPIGQHSAPIPGIGIPEFLPDLPLEDALELTDDVSNGLPKTHSRYVIPPYKERH